MNCLVANYLEGQYHFGCEPKDSEHTQGSTCDPNEICNACDLPIGETGEKPLGVTVLFDTEYQGEDGFEISLHTDQDAEWICSELKDILSKSNTVETKAVTRLYKSIVKAIDKKAKKRKAQSGVK